MAALKEVEDSICSSWRSRGWRWVSWRDGDRRRHMDSAAAAAAAVARPSPDVFTVSLIMASATAPHGHIATHQHALMYPETRGHVGGAGAVQQLTEVEQRLLQSRHLRCLRSARLALTGTREHLGCGL